MATILATQTVCVALLTYTQYLSEFPEGLDWAVVAKEMITCRLDVFRN